MSKKSEPKKISEREKARRAAASATSRENAHAEVKKQGGKDMHFDMTKPRLMRHQGR